MKKYSGIEIEVIYLDEDFVVMSSDEFFDNTTDDIFSRRVY